MNEAFTLVPSSDGGMRLYLNLARTGFVVHVSPAELDAIRKRVEAWHTDMHRKSGGTAVSGDPMPYVRREMMGVLMQRMAEVTPPGLMGAVAKAQLKKRVVAKAPAKKPLPAPAKKPVAKVAPKAPPRPVAKAPVKPPVKAPPPKAAAAPGLPKADKQKAATVQQGLKIVAARAAAHIAQAKRKSPKPNAAEVKHGQDVARKVFADLGVPSTTVPNAFWAQPIATIKTRVQTAIKLAEGRGAPVPAKVVKLDPKKTKLVQDGLKLLAARRARMIAFEKRKQTTPNAEETKQGQAFANEQFTKSQVPTTVAPGPFWNATLVAIKQKVDEVLRKAETTGAPKTLPKAFKLERTKLAAVQKGLKTVATRRAKFLAWQRKAKVTPVDIKTGEVFAKDFALKNGIPSTDAPHQFWTQTLPIIQTKVNAVVQLAEAQGAPAKPVVPGAPIKPIVTAVPASKTTLIKKGLLELAGRRARFLAWQRKAKVTSPADIQAGKDWARKKFTAKNIPVTLPGTKTFIAGVGTTCVIRGWVAPASVMGQGGALTRARQLAPSIKDAAAARSALSLARKQIGEAQALVTRKLGGTISRASGQQQAALSQLDNVSRFIATTEKVVPPSGAISDSNVQNRVALAATQANDALALIDKLESSNFAVIFGSGLKTLFKVAASAVAAVVDMVSAFWSQPEPVIRQRVEDVIKESEKDAPATLPDGGPEVVPPPPGELPPDVEKKRLVVVKGFEAAEAKWKEQLSARSMTAPDNVVKGGVAAHFRANGIPIDRPNPAESFWKQDEKTIADKVASVVNTIQAVAGAPPPPPVPGEAPADEASPGDFPEAADGAIPGDVPPGSPYVPGEIPQPPPSAQLDADPPGTLPTAYEPEYAPGTMEAPGIPGTDPYGDVVPPGQMTEAVTSNISPYEEDPGEMPGGGPDLDELPPEIDSLATASQDYSQTEEPLSYPEGLDPGYAPPAIDESLAIDTSAPEEDFSVYDPGAEEMPPAEEETLALAEEPSMEESFDETPLEEIPEFDQSLEFDTAMPTQEEVTGMYGAYELGAAKPRGNKITKAQYETIVRKRAAIYAKKLHARLAGKSPLVHDATKHKAQEAIWTKAKGMVDADLKKKGVAIAGEHLLGVSDIMGASFIIGQAAQGDPRARQQIANAQAHAKAGNPKARRDVKALAIAAGRRRRRRGTGVPFASQEAVYNWPAQQRNR